MAVQIVSVLLVIVWSVLCSGTQQGVSSTQAGQTLQIQSNVRKYNKHTVTEKPCTTGSTTGTRKDKPDNYSDAQDYVPIGSGGSGSGATGPGYPYPYAPYPYPQPYQPGGNYPYRLQYPYEPLQYPVEAYPQPPPPTGPFGYTPSYYPVAPYPALPYHPTSYPAAYPVAPPQQLYDQSPTVVDAYRTDQPQFFKQPVAGPVPYGPYASQQPSLPHFRAHAYNRPATPSFFQQQRDATATATAATNAAEPSQQYETQSASAGPFDGNQYHY